MNINDVTHEIIGAAIKVHKILGPGLLESAYEACLERELLNRGLHVQRQRPVPLVFEGLKLECGFRADMLVEGCVIVETKAKECFHPIDKAQLISHLRLLNFRVGLLINFHEVVLKNGIKRLVNDYRPEKGLQRESAKPKRNANISKTEKGKTEKGSGAKSANWAKTVDCDLAGGSVWQRHFFPSDSLS